jgi:transcriptional regulator with XRE-family HTH domain
MTQTLVTPMPLKERLRELRQAAGLTQMELAAAAGLTLSGVTQIEAGKIKNPRLDTLQALAKVLGCTLDDLGQADPPADAPPARRQRGKGGKS